MVKVHSNLQETLIYPNLLKLGNSENVTPSLE